MDIEILGLLGYVFAATTLAKMLYERRRDVLSGPYIQGGHAGLAKKRFRNSAIDRLYALEGTRMVYLGSTAAC